MIMIIILTVFNKELIMEKSVINFLNTLKRKESKEGDKAPFGQFRLIVIIIAFIREQTR